MIFRMLRDPHTIRLFMEIKREDLDTLDLTPDDIQHLAQPAPNTPAEWLEDFARLLRAHARTHQRVDSAEETQGQ